MLLSTGAMVSEVRVGREWKLEGKLGLCCKHVVHCYVSGELESYVHVLLCNVVHICFTRAGEHMHACTVCCCTCTL